MSKDCTVKGNTARYSCSNCKKTQKYGHLASHTSTSNLCPIFAKEADNIIRRTICDTKNFPIQGVSDRRL